MARFWRKARPPKERPGSTDEADEAEAADAAVLVKWQGNPHVFVLDTSLARQWLAGTLSGDQYFAEAVEEAREDARAEVEDLITAD